MIDIDHYRRRLLALERSVLARTNRAVAAGSLARDAARDAGDASHADEVSSETFAEAELSGSTLAQIRAALVRLDAGTFGACVVDGAPISESRLVAVPWAAYCLVHAEEAEGEARSRSTL
jgi:RNA polymerase-binding transcription factor DksA